MDDRFKEQQIKDNAKQMRAVVLTHAIEVEDMLTEALGYFYSETRSTFSVYRLLEDLLTDLTFDKKIKLFKKFVDLVPEYFELRPSIIKDLYHIKDVRNQMAHRTTFVPWIMEDEPDWKEKVSFTKPGKTGFTFTVDELADYKNLCEYVVLCIVTALHKSDTPAT